MVDIIEYADQVWTGASDTERYRSGELRRAGLHEVGDQIWMWPAFGNVYVIDTDEGPVLFDTGERSTARALHAAVSERFSQPVHTAIYSHGHLDHVFGLGPFDDEATERDAARPRVVAHQNVAARFDRYRASAGYNGIINQRQFGSLQFKWPTHYRYPDVTYSSEMTLQIGGQVIELRHARGETDDATIGWLPQQRALMCGDFFIWASPNAGNPQKVQRYAREWAEALRMMAGLGAQILLPGHGLPVSGEERVRGALLDSAELLEQLHDQTLAAMNRGETLDEVLQSVQLPERLLRQPFLRPVYDEPEFVIRNIWRLYGGWYDGNPAGLKPPARSDLAAEIAQLCGGAHRLAARAGEVDDRLAAALVQFAADAAPQDPEIHRVRAEVFGRLQATAGSTMSKGIYGWARAESAAIAGGGTIDDVLRGELSGSAAEAHHVL